VTLLAALFSPPLSMCHHNSTNTHPTVIKLGVELNNDLIKMFAYLVSSKSTIADVAGIHKHSKTQKIPFPYLNWTLCTEWSKKAPQDTPQQPTSNKPRSTLYCRQKTHLSNKAENKIRGMENHYHTTPVTMKSFHIILFFALAIVTSAGYNDVSAEHATEINWNAGSYLLFCFILLLNLFLFLLLSTYISLSRRG
jgi:hypothetical protein